MARLSVTRNPRGVRLWRLLVIYASGIVAGIQGGLYLTDLYDDGVADWRSGAIAVVLVVLGLAFVARTFWRDDDVQR